MDQVEGRSFSSQEEEEQHSFKGGGKPWMITVAKLLLIPFLLFASLTVGLAIGYSVLGKQPVSEIFSVQTYKHMYDLIFTGK
ncbi:DNA-directed RNA polymerase subunit beta [Brevibacillus sp. SYSU BS000544]|uniref:DNA-directed RNA polymerase subunit beta n=1 Tax=Brevibacillus sp. SYSU BS000544 TaxID=3416443 RepID=UPI003CE4FD46